MVYPHCEYRLQEHIWTLLMPWTSAKVRLDVLVQSKFMFQLHLMLNSIRVKGSWKTISLALSIDNQYFNIYVVNTVQ